jgi:hypothetical protein
MNEDVLFLSKHRSNGALFDANLLLVYAVGKTDPTRLAHFHHTKQYEHDFELIERLLGMFRVVFTTPNVLTEVSNLGGRLGPEFFHTLARIVSILDEQYCPSKDAAAQPIYRQLGLTDAGLYAVAARHLIVTADFPLYQMLRANRIDAVNFHHLRPLGWAGVNGWT